MTLDLKDNPQSVYPDALFCPGSQPDPDHPWWVARTRTRQEKALARSLRGKAIPYFLPLVARPQKNRDRMRTSIVPLFSGYLFFQAGPHERQEALQSGHLAQAIPVKDQNMLHGQLQAISRVCALEMNLELVDFAQPGKTVRIIAGPFTGLKGVVRTIRNTRRLVLNVDAIGQAVAVEIGLDQIQPE
jgi:transcription antitermination factor NusG